MKETMMQYFEWYCRNDGWHWNRLKKSARKLKKLGISQIWMPPAYKGSGGKFDVGYGVYDMYDLGEFDQKNTVRTKYGTREQYLKAIKSLQKHGIKALADIVFNHRMGADEMERVQAREVDWNDRTQVVSGEHDVDVWTRFYFPGRQGKYSNFEWNWTCFTGTDYDALNRRHGIMEFKGKTFDPYVSKELGNFDFIMGNDVDFRCPWVLEELENWGKWYVETTGIDGFRLDAIKSIDRRFFYQWIKVMEYYASRQLYAVGEYWSGNLYELEEYLDACQYSMTLFDVPLHYHLFDCSRSNGCYDIRKIFDGTLSQTRPDYAVAFVDNHDTQPMQALESWVEDWFKTSAYALILLKQCKNPCVFYGDFKGIPHNRKQPVTGIKEMMWIRSHLLSDEIIDCFDEDTQKACWISNSAHPVAVLFSIGDWKEKWLQFPQLANMTLVDIFHPSRHVKINQNGEFLLKCDPGSCSIFIRHSDYKKMKGDLINV